MKNISRVTRTKEEAKTSYDMMSKWYDLFTKVAEKKYKSAGLKKLNAQTGETVLEIGFGTGECIISLAESVGISGKVYGIDLSAGMLHVAQKKVSKSAISERVELKLGDGANLPFSNKFFNAVFISFTLELFDTPEIPLVLDECKRVLKPNGRICIVSMLKEEHDGLMVKFYEFAHLKFPKYVDCRPIYVQKNIEDAGFKKIDNTVMHMFGLPVEIILAQKM
ncbi:MAG: class I SAM-dependent methyltransferase [Spirochaetia bacterium]|nr:class I SAM-dependent methyltransferase [Spirochaetia bacterium]